MAHCVATAPRHSPGPFAGGSHFRYCDCCYCNNPDSAAVAAGGDDGAVTLVAAAPLDASISSFVLLLLCSQQVDWNVIGIPLLAAPKSTPHPRHLYLIAVAGQVFYIILGVTATLKFHLDSFMGILSV